MFSTFTKTFTAFDKLMDAVSEDMDTAFNASTLAEGGVLITSNNGHVVITGNVKSLRVNEQVIEVGEITRERDGKT